MKGGVKGSDKDLKYMDHINNKNGFPNSIKQYINPFIQVWYATHSVWESNT